MEHTEFPKWKYHDKQDAVVVQNADEEDALGEGWRDTPDERSDAPAEEAKPAAKKPAKK